MTNKDMKKKSKQEQKPEEKEATTSGPMKTSNITKVDSAKVVRKSVSEINDLMHKIHRWQAWDGSVIVLVQEYLQLFFGQRKMLTVQSRARHRKALMFHNPPVSINATETGCTPTARDTKNVASSLNFTAFTGKCESLCNKAKKTFKRRSKQHATSFSLDTGTISLAEEASALVAQVIRKVIGTGHTAGPWEPEKPESLQLDKPPKTVPTEEESLEQAAAEGLAIESPAIRISPEFTEAMEARVLSDVSSVLSVGSQASITAGAHSPQLSIKSEKIPADIKTMKSSTTPRGGKTNRRRFRGQNRIHPLPLSADEVTVEDSTTPAVSSEQTTTGVFWSVFCTVFKQKNQEERGKKDDQQKKE